VTYVYLRVTPSGFPVNERFEAQDLVDAQLYCERHRPRWDTEQPNRLCLSLDGEAHLSDYGYEPRWSDHDYAIWGLAYQLPLIP
jgi:hypothetical protein